MSTDRERITMRQKADHARRKAVKQGFAKDRATSTKARAGREMAADRGGLARRLRVTQAFRQLVSLGR